MNVFDFRHKLIADYSAYIKSFLAIRDERVSRFVGESLEAGALWPEPLIQLNPSFQPGLTIDQLVSAGILHESCKRVFRRDKSETDPIGKPLRLHQHQDEAIRIAQSGHNYVLTTGTGSGKSMAYIVPIVNHVLRIGSGKGIQAIVVYPMNALANSQLGELQKFLQFGFGGARPPVTFARYTGQEPSEEREAILQNPPDILLTNYVMLELILTRPREVDRLVKNSKGLQFFVLDELHTYRGRQGADVGMLCRRVRNLVESPNLQCVGTSATIAGGGTILEQKAEVAEVATTIFGSPVLPEHVIGETLERITQPDALADQSLKDALAERLANQINEPSSFEAFIVDPLAIWLEQVFGVKEEEGSRQLIRATPRSLHAEGGAGDELSRLTGADRALCIREIEKCLLNGNLTVRIPDTGLPIFAFRLHQFISRGDTVFSSLEPAQDRYLTIRKQQFVPDDRSKILLPLVFCRECGQDYYMVRRQPGAVPEFTPRDLRDLDQDDSTEAGFLYPNEANPWPSDSANVIERLPDTFLEEHRGATRVKSSFRSYLPSLLTLASDGTQASDGKTFAYFRAPLRFCLNCGVAYQARRGDFSKLSTLASEGRSTATTILALSAIRQLRADQTLEAHARKLLSFTDNRQDASLQAGHFNDFIEIGLLRSAIYRATADAGDTGIEHSTLAQKVSDALNLPLPAFAAEPDAKFAQAANTKKALRDVLGYRIYHDLRRGWRVTAPNLEQCGLLEIEYEALRDFCADEEVWSGAHAALTSASIDTRFRVCKTLLDFLRRSLAIKVDYLDQTYQDSLRLRSNQHLIDPWGVDENERLEYAATVFPRSVQGKDFQGNVFLSGRSGFGIFLGANSTFADFHGNLTLPERESIIKQLLERLHNPGGFLTVVSEPTSTDESDVPGYQLVASSMIWKAGCGTVPFHDPIQTPQAPLEGGRPNPFFVEFYRTVAAGLTNIHAREHTAQVPARERERRELSFRKADLPILFCSPTMELGIDIKDLNVVNMRNVPPTPANYAQRSGRAGRSGQPALVFTYCTTGSPHDQYFFRRPELMVSGRVAPPRIDLANEDLVRAHLHAIWLTETGMSLESSLTEILDVGTNTPTLKILPSKMADIENTGARARALIRAHDVLKTIEGALAQTEWHYQEWPEDVLKQVSRSFDEACNRWRTLYRSAIRQASRQDEIIRDATRSSDEREEAKRLRKEAEDQLSLLIETRNVSQSDFYSYRYFASEGFLPGYNFPRLPISAYISARRTKGDHNEFLSRPRFLAISEFGPRALVYHEGSKYIINKVIMPVDEVQGDGKLQTKSIKLCPNCGHLHEDVSTDRCELCEGKLGATLGSLFRMENVSTKRREKINSDEEERLRMGYEIRSGIRFAERDGRRCIRSASIQVDGKNITSLSYGDAATLWRINYGWARRKERGKLGFVLDLEKGTWQPNADLPAESNEEEVDPSAAVTKRVIPYVEDRRNALIIECSTTLEAEQMASLQAALKMAIQVEFQLEDSELAAEPLPSADERNYLLYFEASEGGAGALRRLVDEKDAMTRVARRALEICHFDPDSGDDIGHAKGARERCAAACYDCLMSYYNQRDHRMLDRFLIKDLLMELARGTTDLSPTPMSRGEHLSALIKNCDSELEREWLDFINHHSLRLPTHSQELIAACNTRPDFLYREKDKQVAIYIDGSPHDFPERQTRDKIQTDQLEDYGFLVLRFHHTDDWEATIRKYPGIFGELKPEIEETGESEIQPAHSSLDLDLFESRWHPIVVALHASADLKVASGRDLMRKGRVAGSAFAVVGSNGNEACLVDADSPGLKELLQSAPEHSELLYGVRESDDPEALLTTLREILA